MSHLTTSIAGSVSASSLSTPTTSLVLLSSMTSSVPLSTKVALTTAKSASVTWTSEASPTTESTAAIAPVTSSSSTDVTTVLKRSSMTNDLLKMIWTCKRLVHAEVFVFVVAVLEAAALIFDWLVVGGCVPVSLGPGGDLHRGFLCLCCIIILPGSLLCLLFALVFRLLLVV